LGKHILGVLAAMYTDLAIEDDCDPQQLDIVYTVSR